MGVSLWGKYELDTCGGNFCMLIPLGPLIKLFEDCKGLRKPSQDLSVI